MKKPTVISIIGPTAVGKTKLGIEISKRFNGEVINGDSMQIYKHFDIGSAKVTDKEKDGIPHHLIDILEPEEDYSVAQFKNDVNQKIIELTHKKKIPIIVGGTGFYIHAALYNFDFPDIKRNDEYVERLTEEINAEGIEPYYEKLKRLDPVQARKIHPNNIRKVIRALEVIETTGKKMSTIEQEQINVSPYNPIIIGLSMEREVLYDRINHRVDLMIEQGLVNEVQLLYERYGSNIQPMKGIGYKELVPYFNKEYSLNEAIDLIKRNTRRFAKRQFTYYRNKIPDVRWYPVDPKNHLETFTIIFKDLEGML
ncbi:tRNA (adenosine(37)-N6)-dimethylallyltransferase MiaA [Bacillaceae bacterium W0354]